MLQPELNQEDLLRRITNRIRQSLELQEILTATVAEIRTLLGTDRVMVYRFNESGGGEVIAESILDNCLPSFKGLNFPADDIPESAREIYLKERQRSIVDVSAGLIGLSPIVPASTGASSSAALGTAGASQRTSSATTLEEIHYRPVDPCHATYLKAMGVQSSMVLPILHYDIQAQHVEERLWGLLVSHNVKPRAISPRELEIVQSVVDQVSIAIAQSALLSQARQQHRTEATINQVSALLHSMPTIELQAALQETITAFQGCGGRLYIAPYQTNGSPELFVWGTQPRPINGEKESLLEEHPVFSAWASSGVESLKQFQQNTSAGVAVVEESLNAGNRLLTNSCPIPNPQSPIPNLPNSGCEPLTISDLYNTPALGVLRSAFEFTPIRGMLVLPLCYRYSFLGYLSIFRSAVDREILWAGQFDTSKKQRLPRKSFEAWRELKRGQAQEWSGQDVELAIALGHHFAMAIGQYELYAQVHSLNENLERQVAERTAKLQQALDREQAVQRVTNQIRSSLDLKTTLQTIVREVRTLLDTDRVVIYQLAEDSQGEVIVESIEGNWSSILGISNPQGYFPDAQSQSYTRKQVINDISQANLTPSHREFLAYFQIQATLIVPIGVGDHLWGLLIAQECKAPRDWQECEIELLQQLADQAAVAIQQAELYEQSRTAAAVAEARAGELAIAIEELKKTQTQLIQTEKMSSLGHLIAGVAHEINNPVNFICGNLSYTSQYAHDLLDLLKLYQKHYPYPDPEIAEQAEEMDLDFLWEDLPKILNSLKLGTDRIRNLVLSLRNFSRLDQAEMKAVDIHEGLDSTLLILQHRLKAKPNQPAIQVVKNYGDLPLVECYASQLNQVFMNVLGNAIDALEEYNTVRTLEEIKNSPSQITVCTSLKDVNLLQKGAEQSSRVGDWESGKAREITLSPEGSDSLSTPTVVIQIMDNGSGISKELQTQIFDPFFTTKPIGKGTGLGLSISYQIVVEKHGGIFKCFSEPGKGTEFWIEIPIRQPQAT